jgi:hypothetical protein
MPLVNDDDINVHLPTDKISAEEGELLEGIKEDIERIIRGYLAGHVDPLEMAAWLTPETTPDIIRAIGGRLGAAFIYRKRYSEDSLDDPQYAQFKYNEAMAMLTGIIAGDIAVDPDIPPVGVEFTSDLFYPNDPNTDPPKFTMSSQF